MQTSADENSSAVLHFAAQELDKYVKEMIPGRGEDAWSVQFAVDPALGAPCRNDCFQIRITENGGKITGNTAGSVLLGVYDYLKRLGCRFLAPGRAREHVPLISSGDLTADYRKQASFYHRGVCIEGADSYENIRDFIDWLPKIGCNTFFFQFRTPRIFMKRYYAHEGNPGRKPERFTGEDAEASLAALEKEVKKRGLLLHEMGHGWTASVLGYDSDSWERAKDPDLPRVKRWAAQIQGRRALYQGIPINTNLCYNKKEAEDAFAACVLAYARQHPQIDYLHIWLADLYNNVCECADCAKTTISDQYVALLNEIDRRLTEERLPVKLVFLLYQELLWPPEKERLLHPERFVLMFAPISRTFETSYDLTQVPKELPAYRRNRIVLPTALGENLAFLKGWQKIFEGDGFVYDYPLGRAHYGDFGYLHMARVISGDIKKLKQMHLDGCISCQELRVCLPNALPNYVMGYTLFDADADVEELIDEYFAAAYGSFARQVRAYLERLSSDVCCDYITGKGPRKDSAVAEKMRDAIACCASFDTGFIRDGLGDLLGFHKGYVRRLASLLLDAAEGHPQALPDKWKDLQTYLGKNEKRYQPYLDVYRVLEVLKNYALLEEEKDEA